MSNSNIASDLLAAQRKVYELQQLKDLAERQERELEEQRLQFDETKQAEIAENQRLQSLLSERLEFLNTLKDFSNFDTQREELERQLRVLNTQENNQVAMLENTILQIGGIIQRLLSKGWSKSPVEFQQAVVLEVSKRCSLPQARVSKILYR